MTNISKLKANVCAHFGINCVLISIFCSCVLALDLDGEVWKKIKLPDEVGYGSGNRVYLLDYDGCLSVIQISDASMNIWVLKDYEMGEWNLVDRVSLQCIRGLVPGVFPISQTGEYVFFATYKQVLVYRRNGGVWKEMYSVKGSFPLPLWFSAHAFRRSLFSSLSGIFSSYHG
ncbi:unnamed protein product, partial [Vitis vinifera]